MSSAFLATLYEPLVRLTGLHNQRKVARNFRYLVDPDRTRLLIACMPKSGSTYSSRLLESLTGFRSYSLAFAYGRNEQEISWPRLIPSLRRDALFVQQHIRASKVTLDALDIFHVTPIVQIRNIFDVIMSLRDHLACGEFEGPMAYVDARFLRQSQDKQLDFIIDLMIPWYVNFFVSWSEAESTMGARLFWLRYEELTAAPVAVLARLCDHVGLDTDRRQIEVALVEAAAKPTRFNQGIIGRGVSGLSEAQKNRVRAQAAHYPWVDFTPIGLGPDEPLRQPPN